MSGIDQNTVDWLAGDDDVVPENAAPLESSPAPENEEGSPETIESPAEPVAISEIAMPGVEEQRMDALPDPELRTIEFVGTQTEMLFPEPFRQPKLDPPDIPESIPASKLQEIVPVSSKTEPNAEMPRIESKPAESDLEVSESGQSTIEVVAEPSPQKQVHQDTVPVVSVSGTSIESVGDVTGISERSLGELPSPKQSDIPAVSPASLEEKPVPGIDSPVEMKHTEFKAERPGFEFSLDESGQEFDFDAAFAAATNAQSDAVRRIEKMLDVS